MRISFWMVFVGLGLAAAGGGWTEVLGSMTGGPNGLEISGDEIWMGTNRGEKIGYFPAP